MKVNQFEIIPTMPTASFREMRIPINDAALDFKKTFLVESFSQRGSAINGDDLLCLHIDTTTRDVVLKFYHDVLYNLEM